MLPQSSRWIFSAALLIGCAAPSVACSGAHQSEGGLARAGTTAPDLRTSDHRGQPVALAELGGKPALVFFYPRDDTPGCTKEACALRDVWNDYTQAGVLVLGVSADSNESHAAFAEKHNLPFGLIADTDGAWAKAFGVDTTMGMYKRVSFLLGADGKIAMVYPNVDPGVHAKEVLDDVATLAAGQ